MLLEPVVQLSEGLNRLENFNMVFDVNAINIIMGIIISYAIPKIYTKMKERKRKEDLQKFFRVIQEKIQFMKHVTVHLPQNPEQYKDEIEGIIVKLEKMELHVDEVYGKTHLNTYMDGVKLLKEKPKKNEIVKLESKMNSIDLFLKDVLCW